MSTPAGIPRSCSRWTRRQRKAIRYLDRRRAPCPNPRQIVWASGPKTVMVYLYFPCRKCGVVRIAQAKANVPAYLVSKPYHPDIQMAIAHALWEAKHATSRTCGCCRAIKLLGLKGLRLTPQPPG